jgi:PKD repeat protein
LLEWPSTDADAEDAVTFDLYMSLNPYPDTLIAGNLADSSRQLPPLRYNTQYFWRVVATDSKGTQTLGDVWTFRTAPSNGLEPLISNLQVMIQPNGGDPAPGNSAGNNDTIIVSFDLNRDVASSSVTFGPYTFTPTASRATGATLTYAVTGSETPDTYPLIVQGLDDGGNVFYDASQEISLSFTEPTVAFSASLLSGPAPLTVQFTDETPGVVTEWSWEFGDGKTSTEQHPVHTYLNPGLYSVTLTTTNAAGTDSVTKVDYVSCQGVILKLIKGWNLISMPVYPRVNNVEEVSRGILRGIPYIWNQQRRRYVRASRDTRTLNAFQPMQGYYFFTRNDSELIIGGRPPETTVHTFENGWNVIGPSQTGWYDFGDFIFNGWYLDPDARRYVDVPRDDQGRLFLQATRAYWLFLKHPAGEFTIDLAAPVAR